MKSILKIGWVTAAVVLSAGGGLADVLIETTNSTTSMAFSGNISATDLINVGQLTLASATLPATHSAFAPGGLNDGVGNSSVPGGNVYFDIPGHLSAVVSPVATFDLDATSNTNGYSITSIRTISGWAAASQSQANQKYEIYFKTVGASSYALLTNVDYSPFPMPDGLAFESQATITNSGGVLATGVVSLQFVFQLPTVYGGNYAGCVYREVDVTGYLTVTNPPPARVVSLSLPKTRQIVQRDARNSANLTVQGTLSGGAARLEARAVVMPGVTNNGVSTDWVVIADAATNGAFLGVISNLTAGGWYRVEVRAVDPASNVLATSGVDRVGVGDVYVTAGQSNAGCFGSPPQRPGDDRVSAYTLNVSPAYTWRLATDPQPNISGFVSGGGNGSAWPILGTRLVRSNGVPTGFVGLAYGATALTDWSLTSANYRNLTNTLVRFGTNGVRAVLWHQGESDSLASTTANTYFQRFSNIVYHSRKVAGWCVPWGIAEVAFHPDASRAMEEPVAAGQRLVTYGLTNCFRGPRTDDFNLESKVSDGVHFNAAGLSDHAQQWANVLCGVEDLTPKNANFEANVALGDGVSSFANRVIGWNKLNALGSGLAAGNNGYFNPGPSSYSNAGDTNNGGILPNMNGKHVGTLAASVTSNAFLQTLRAQLQPSTVYTFSVALGVRDNTNVFGGYRLDILANGVPLGGGVAGDLGTLNALAGGSATGAFTVVSCVHTSSAPVVSNQQLAIRITKTGGFGTYLDFDNAQVTSRLSGYGQFQTNTWGSLFALEALPDADPEGDGLPNLIEYKLGTDPKTRTPMPLPAAVRAGGEDYVQMELYKNPVATSGSVELLMSDDLMNWFAPTNSSDVILWDDATVYRVQLRRGAVPMSFFRIVGRLP